MKRLRTKTGVSLLLVLFLLLLINTDVRAALFSGLSFLGRGLADEFNRVFVNTLDTRSIPEKELPIIIKPVENEEKGVREFVPLENAELVSAVSNNSADSPILASPIASASYSVSGSSGVRYNSDPVEPGEITGSVPMEEQILPNENAREKSQLEEAKLQEELLKQLLAAAEENLAAAGQTETAPADTESVSEAAPAEQTSTAEEDTYTRHQDAIGAIDNVKRLLSDIQQETNAAQAGSAEVASVSESTSSKQTSSAGSVSGAQGSGDQEAETGAEPEGYYCSGGVCYPGKAPANSSTSISYGFNYGSSAASVQNQNSPQQAAGVQTEETTGTAQSATEQGSSYCSDGVCYNSLMDLEDRINNIGKIAEESLTAVDGASYLSDSASADTTADLSSSYDLSGDTTGEDLTALEERLSKLETRVDELEKEVYGVTYSGDTSISADTSLEQRLAGLESRVAVLESVMKDIKDTINGILNGSSSETTNGSSNIDSDASAELDDAVVAGIEKRLAEFMGETGGFAKIALVETNEGYIFCDYDQQGNIQPFLLLGGAAQYTGENQVALYYDNFLPLVAPVALVADELAGNGHNCIKIYLPPDNLTASDAQDLAQFIQELYIYYDIRTYILHFAGLYASSETEFLLNNPTEENVGKVTKLVQDFAQWVKDLGPAAAGVQLGNENEYYVKDAGMFYFTNGEWNTINLSADAYYAFMNTLAGVYKQIDPAHPVFLGHGELDSGQIPLLKDNLTNFDGIAVN
ncbi:MAG: hypothetical protein V1662_06290, partial [Candidatus Omnitrophota bacterium]